MKLLRTIFGGKNNTNVGRTSKSRRPLVIEALEERRLLSSTPLSSFPGFHGSVSVAVGDVNGDGRADIITGAGAGAAGHVKVFDGNSGQILQSFFAYGSAFQGGVNVAAGDVNGDGRAEIITAAGPGAGPHVKVFDGLSGQNVRSFFAYGAGFQGGVNVAAGDVTGDGKDDIITGVGPGGGSHVKVFDGQRGQLVRSFFAHDSGFQGGVTVGAGDVNSDGFADIIMGTATGASHVKVFSGQGGQLLQSFLAFDAFAGGVNVAAGDYNGDHFQDIVTGSASGAPHVKVFDGRGGQLLQSFLPYGGFVGGVRVASGDVDGDGRDDIVTGMSTGTENRVMTLAAVDAFIWFEAPGISKDTPNPVFEIKDFSFGVENPTTIGSATGAPGKIVLAAVDAFIWFEHPGTFAIKDFSFGVENPTAIGSATGGAGAGKIKFNEFTITKTSDSASPVFFKNCCTGAHYKTVIIEMCPSDPYNAGRQFLSFHFETVFTTKIDWSGPGNDGPEESITFVYGKLGVQYAVGEATYGRWVFTDCLVTVQYRESDFAFVD